MNELIKFDIPADAAGYAALTPEALDKLELDAFAVIETLREKGASAFTTTDLDALRVLRDVVTTVRAEREQRDATATEGAELLDGLEPPAAATEGGAAEAEGTTEGTEATEEAATDDTTTTEQDDEQTEAGDAQAKEKDEALVASGKQGGARTAPRVGDVAKNAKTPAQVAQEQLQESFAHLVEGPDADGKKFESWLDVAKVAERRLASYAGIKHGSGAHTIATIQREFAKEFVVGDDNADAILDFAANESRLPGGNLVAAAGWCAPSQTVYDLIELESSDGMVDLPEVQVTRGGLRFTPGPDFSSIFAGSGYFHQTEAQVIANTTKPCMEIPCPSFQDVRMEVDGICITGSILQRRGYPELVERFIRGALVAHAHKLNAFVINQLVAQSTAVDLSPSLDVPLDTGTTGVLATVEMVVEDIRYRHRMPLNTSVEVKMPHWVLPVMRADLSRRNGVDMLSVTDAQLTAHFAMRGARVQFVYDWQDAYNGGGTVGGATALTKWPREFTFLAYPAGTFVRGSDSLIRLDTIYDSTNLATNRYTALFSEEGVLVAKRGHDARAVTVALEPEGASGAQVAYVAA
jgi:hypothetical protein